jgi:outer membrane immunogenic protein
MHRVVSYAAVSVAAMMVACGSASAADLGRPIYEPPQAPMAAPPLRYSWTGFYLGANVGGLWSDGRLANTLVGQSWNETQSNFTFGAQMGYNWQINNIVLGVEGGIQSTQMSWSSLQFAVPATGVFQARGSADWMATLAGRLGFASDNWLFYAKAGGAWVDGDVRITNLTSGAVASSSDMASAWLVGGGIEYAWARNWTTRLEYNYIAVDDRTGPGPLGNSNIVSSNDIQTLTLGVNYKF